MFDRKACFAAALIAFAGPCLAFQTDLHYGLTYWLALSAGLSPQESHHMAIGNERSDSGMLDAKHAIIWQLCVKGDTNASMLTRKLHFRSQAPVPAPRAARPVASAASFASTEVNAIIAETGTEYSDRLYNFGQALHAWQDTFSHQGVPASVLRCREDWIWSHPAERNGPATSDADITHMHTGDCDGAAQSSYEKIRSFLAKNRQELRPPPWPTLAERAKAFCRAQTKTEKVAWFEANGVPLAASIVKNSSLEDGPRRFRRVPDLNLEPVAPTAQVQPALQPLYLLRNPAPTPDKEVQAAVADILRRLDVGASPSDAQFMRRFFQVMLTSAPQALGTDLAPFFGSTSALPLSSRPVQTALRLRMADRGAASRPAVLTLALVSQPDVLVSALPEQWQNLLVPVRAREQTVLVGVLPGGGEALGLAVLRHAPYEVVRVFASQSKPPIIKDIDVIPFH